MSSLAFGGPSISELLSNVSIPASVCLPLINPEAVSPCTPQLSTKHRVSQVQKAFGTLFETVKKQVVGADQAGEGGLTGRYAVG